MLLRQVACAAWEGRNLLTAAVGLKDIGLTKDVLRALDAYVGSDPTRFPGGLPYYDATHLQVRRTAPPASSLLLLTS